MKSRRFSRSSAETGNPPVSPFTKGGSGGILKEALCRPSLELVPCGDATVGVNSILKATGCAGGFSSDLLGIQQSVETACLGRSVEILPGFSNKCLGDGLLVCQIGAEKAAIADLVDHTGIAST